MLETLDGTQITRVAREQSFRALERQLGILGTVTETPRSAEVVRYDSRPIGIFEIRARIYSRAGALTRTL